MQRVRGGNAGPPGGPPGTLDDLRQLLVGPEQSRIEQLEGRVEPTPEAVGKVLPEAVVLSEKTQGEQLGLALQPAVVSSVRHLAREDTELFAESLAPAIGAAVRKAVASAMRAMLERLNAALEKSFSVERWRWRLEARRTGRPFAEVALLRSLLYRVEQVFLIHKETGLLLAHALAKDVTQPSPDEVSAMLRALEAFVRESFQEPGAGLERFEVGELTCWVERGGRAPRAAVVRGVAPEGYRAVLRETEEHIEEVYQKELAGFRGDTSPFAATLPTLEGCLKEQRKPPSRGARRASVVLLVLLGALLLFAVGYGIYAWWRGERRLAEYTALLKEQPGLVVTSAERARGRYVFTGLRDPLAKDPAVLLASRGLHDAETHFEPFYSLDPGLSAARLKRLLSPPPGVTLRLEGGTLYAVGVAPRAWVERARSLAAAAPGVERFEGSGLTEEEEERARASARALGQMRVHFPPGSARLYARGRAQAEEAAREAKRLFLAAQEAGVSACLEVVGRADLRGAAAKNQRLSQRRAEAVAARLREEGVPRERLLTHGEGEHADSGERARSVIFRPTLSSPEDPDPCPRTPRETR